MKKLLTITCLLFLGLTQIKAQEKKNEPKAEIEFEEFGKKMIVLRFAKLKLL